MSCDVSLVRCTDYEIDLICTANAFEWTVAEEPTEPAEESELPEGPAEAA